MRRLADKLSEMVLDRPVKTVLVLLLLGIVAASVLNVSVYVWGMTPWG